MCEPTNLPRIGEDSYKKTKKFTPSAGPSASSGTDKRQALRQAQGPTTGRKPYSLLYTFTVYLS